MDMNDIKGLDRLKYDFDPYFSSRVMAKLDAEGSAGLSWKWLSPAFAFVLIAVLWVFIQDGSLTVDSILGLTEYDESLKDYLMYY